MAPTTFKLADISLPDSQTLNLTGYWTATRLHEVIQKLDSFNINSLIISSKNQTVTLDCSNIEALDTAGAWLINNLLKSLKNDNFLINIKGLNAQFSALMTTITEQITEDKQHPNPLSSNNFIQKNLVNLNKILESAGRSFESICIQTLTFLAFIGETTLALVGCFIHPSRFRWRSVFSNIQISGFNALPIVGLLAFLLGVVVAYQGSDQLKQYGANIFVVDLIGLSMLREFAPLITAIIIAGRSGSAYAAQIGSMAVTEEIDAMRTLGISPQEMLVLPKLIALVIALPLLTVFADLLGVFGGMLMAYTQLNVGFGEFLDRFVYAVSPTAFLIGVGKAPVFAAIIVIVGCFQGFNTKGGANNVGQQTTRSVVQSIFLVVVADALFSIVFSTLGL